MGYTVFYKHLVWLKNIQNDFDELKILIYTSQQPSAQFKTLIIGHADGNLQFEVKQ